MRQIKQFSGHYQAIVQLIYRFFLLQLYWLGFSLLGLIVFGVFPATYSLVLLMREKSQLDAKEMFHLFWQTYRSHWKKMTQGALIWYTMFTLMCFNLLIIEHAVIRLVVWSILIYMLLALVYFLLTYRANLPVSKQIYLSFGYGFVFPKNNLVILFCIFSLYVGLHYIPGFVFFFGMSLLVFCLSKLKLQLSVEW